MTKDDQKLFYESVGRALTRAREQHKMSISQLARKASDQYNTIAAIEQGKPFMAHQLHWMRKELNMNLNILINDAINENGITSEIKEESDGQEESESYDLGSFI